MRRLALVFAACIGSTAAAAYPMSNRIEGQAPLDVPPAYLDRGAIGPNLKPGAGDVSTGCQWIRRELLDERGEIRVFRVPACL